MRAAATHSPDGARAVPWRRAIGLEFRLLGALRWRFMVVSATSAAVCFLYWAVRSRNDPTYDPPQLAGTFLATMLIALFWPAEAWRDAPAGDRDGFLAQPIHQGWHELARVVAGASWLLILSLAFAVLVAGAAVIAGSLGEFPRVTPWMALAYVTGPLTAYLLGSIAALRSAHPLRWSLGVPAALALVPKLLEGLTEPSFRIHQHPIGYSETGLFWALIGPINETRPWFMAPGTPWERYWVADAAAWLAIAVVGVLLAAHLRKTT